MGRADAVGLPSSTVTVRCDSEEIFRFQDRYDVEGGLS